MSENSSSRKMLSLVLLAAGVAGMVVSLVMDFSGGGGIETPYRRYGVDGLTGGI